MHVYSVCVFVWLCNDESTVSHSMQAFHGITKNFMAGHVTLSDCREWSDLWLVTSEKTCKAGGDWFLFRTNHNLAFYLCAASSPTIKLWLYWIKTLSVSEIHYLITARTTLHNTPWLWSEDPTLATLPSLSHQHTCSKHAAPPFALCVKRPPRYEEGQQLQCFFSHHDCVNMSEYECFLI